MKANMDDNFKIYAEHKDCCDMEESEKYESEGNIYVSNSMLIWKVLIFNIAMHLFLACI